MKRMLSDEEVAKITTPTPGPEPEPEGDEIILTQPAFNEFRETKVYIKKSIKTILIKARVKGDAGPGVHIPVLPKFGTYIKDDVASWNIFINMGGDDAASSNGFVYVCEVDNNVVYYPAVGEGVLICLNTTTGEAKIALDGGKA